VEASSDTHSALRVTELATQIQRSLRDISPGWVEGEVQKLRRPGSGHVYFTLADRDAAIECVVWRSRVDRIAEWPMEGRLVQAHFERVDFYARHGRVSLHVDAMRLTGEGELLARRAAVLARLHADGLTTRARRSLPTFPRRVGLIAARNSDAKMDVVKALFDRWPSVDIVHCPALVEGVAAVDSLIDALAQLQNAPDVDVIVVGRGGGGVAELTAFDDERLCRAIFAAKVPVVTSIGHTPHRPNCDHVAAAYADVPARAAELVVPSASQVLSGIGEASNAMAGIPTALRSYLHALLAISERAQPGKAIARRQLEMQGLDAHLERAIGRLHASRRQALDEARHRLTQARSAVPGSTTLDPTAQLLHSATERFLVTWMLQLDDSQQSMTTAVSRIPAAMELDGLRARLMPTALRAQRRIRDYDQAVDRRQGEVIRTFTRRVAERTRELAHSAMALTSIVRRRAIEKERALAHITEVIEARDFRRAGWIVASDATGQPVRSALQLAPDDALSLQFEDGRANAKVTSIETEPGGADA
jgi:exodeoxyribonuclease VII large subunit